MKVPVSPLLHPLRIALLCACVVPASFAVGVQANDGRIDRTAAGPKESVDVDAVTPADEPVIEKEKSAISAYSEPSSTSVREATVEEVLEFAEKTLATINEQVNDYTCLLIKRERVDGKDGGWQFMEAKVRHERKDGSVIRVPFSVYLRFLQPRNLAGREVLFVASENNSDLIARRGGRRNPNMTVQLIPTSPLAMEGNRYPITEFGFQTLSKRLIEVLVQEREYRDGELQVFENAKVDSRQCTHYRLTHHKRRDNLTYHMAEVSVDDELGIPIFYRAFDFPVVEGGEPVLLEQYVYRNIKLNTGLTDSDFDVDNPMYSFQLYSKSDHEQASD